MIDTPTSIIVLAGGYGKRLFPLSTPEKPKQFLDITDTGKTLFQQTLERAVTIAEPRDIYTIVCKIHKIHAVMQAMQVGVGLVDNILVEPMPRNTAVSVFMGLEQIRKGIVVVMPSDHYISGYFTAEILKACELAKQGKIVTFGIKPTIADENFGYILKDKFTEKPSIQAAEELISQGALWNSGIYVFDAELMREKYMKFYPELAEPISFDKAIMEKTSKLAVIEAEFEWQDLGSFEAIENFKRRSRVA